MSTQTVRINYMLDLDYFKKRVNLTKHDRLLLKLTFSDVADDTDIINLITNYDMETAPLGFTFLLINLMQKHPHIKVPKEIMPRINGAIRYFQCQNATLLASFSQIGRQLNNKNIPVLLMKGIAMKYLYPNTPRFMGDIDFAVPFNKYDKTIKIAVNKGFKVAVKANHSTDLYRGISQKIDIHRFIVKTDIDTKHFDNKIFIRAKHDVAFGVNVLIPKEEDLIFLILQNACDNIIYSKPYPMQFLWIFDCVNIINKKRNINWDIVLNNAARVNLLCQTRMMLQLFEWLMPSFISKDLIETISITQEEKKDFDEKVKIALIENKCIKIKSQVKKILLSKNKKLKDISFSVKMVAEFIYLKAVHRIDIVRFFLLDKTSKRLL